MLSDYQGVYKQIITGDESWIYAYDPETIVKSIEYRLKGETKPIGQLFLDRKRKSKIHRQ